jgi:hypothetical protein
VKDKASTGDRGLLKRRAPAQALSIDAVMELANRILSDDVAPSAVDLAQADEFARLARRLAHSDATGMPADEASR